MSDEELIKWVHENQEKIDKYLEFTK